VELLIVVTVIAFVAGALVVAARRVMVRSMKANTAALIQKVTTACAMFKDDFGCYPPDDFPITAESQCTSTVAGGLPSPNNDNPTCIELDPNANLVLRLMYLYPSRDSASKPIPQKRYLTLKESELRGGFASGATFVAASDANPAWRLEDARYDSRNVRRGLIIVDAWARPLYYDCQTIDPDPRYRTRSKKAQGRSSMSTSTAHTLNIYPAVHNATGCDIFSCGADGRTSWNNKIDDNQNGLVDSDDPQEYYTVIDGLNISPLSGEAEDDINNWASR
jgi:type II secretory pathway pseudopilin PulG